MTAEKLGRVVWHDFFATDLQRSKRFYGRLADWQFMTERATDFAWGGGTQDYVLALYENEAGAGLIEYAPDGLSGWVPYVEVPDVDAAAAQAEKLGGTIVRPPFEVPGVGRNCLLRDPHGAYLGISLSRHSFPVPRAQFSAERYLAVPEAFPARFYQELCGWELMEGASDTAQGQEIALSGEIVAILAGEATGWHGGARWVPSVRVDRVSEALDTLRALKGELLGADTLDDGGLLVCDASGTPFYLVTR